MGVEIKLDHYDRILEKTRKKKIPFTAHWELTYKCNLRCVHCYIADESEKEELCFSEIRPILDALAKQGCLYLVFSGGEILTRPDFFDIADYARKKGFALRLLTNGTLITAEVADRIKDISVLSVGMSVYGTNPKIHEAFTRIEGSYAKTIMAFELLRERGIKTVIKSLLMRKNVEEFEGLKKLAEELGANFVYDPTIVAKNNGSKEPLRYRMADDELRDFFYFKTRPAERGPLEISDNDVICNAGFNILSISAYGEVFPCVAIRKKCGDLRKEGLAKIWRSRALSEIRAIRFADLWKCKDCGLLYYCDRCPGIAELEDGDILGPSTVACGMAKVRKGVVEGLKNG